jgi:hypothetical protein
MEWKVGNISMLRKEVKLGERKLVCLLLDLVGSKNRPCFFLMLPSTPYPYRQFSSCDLTLPKENSKENQFILRGKSGLEKAGQNNIIFPLHIL